MFPSSKSENKRYYYLYSKSFLGSNKIERGTLLNKVPRPYIIIHHKKFKIKFENLPFLSLTTV